VGHAVSARARETNGAAAIVASSVRRENFFPGIIHPLHFCF
jgi:hypothetical protein